MTKQGALRIVNVILFIDFLGLVTTAAISDALPGEVFGTVHPAFGGIFAILVVTHVILNWNWIKANYPGKKRATGKN